MKRLIFILSLSFGMIIGYGQIPLNLKEGSYQNLSDLLNNRPQFQNKFLISQRSEFIIKMLAGNDYKVVSDSNKIKKSIINSKAFAVYDGKNLYLNGKCINGYKYYCLVENSQRFLIFKAGIPGIFKRRKLGYKNSMIQTDLIPIGGAVGGAINGAQLAMIRLYYVIDCKTGIIKILSRDSLKILLNDYPDLKSEFETENPADNQVELVEFVNKINQK